MAPRKAKGRKKEEPVAAGAVPVPEAIAEPIPKVTGEVVEQRPMTMYDYSVAIREIQQTIDQLTGEDGEITDEVAEKLVALHGGSIQKMQRLVWVIEKAIEGVEQVESQSKRLTALKKYRKGIEDRLKGALVTHILMTQPDRRQIDIDTHILCANKVPPFVTLADDFNDPFYMVAKSIENPSPETLAAAKAAGDAIVYQPDKEAIEAALKAGQTIKGAELVTDKYYLKIR